MSTILSKIGTKTLGFNLVSGELNDRVRKEPVELFHIMGIASGVVAGLSTYGDWQKLTGTFEAVNLFTGEVFVSGNAFLPAIVNDLIAGNFVGEAEDGTTREVRFAYAVGTIPASTQIGYAFTVKELIALEAADPFENMRYALEDSNTPRAEVVKARKTPTK